MPHAIIDNSKIKLSQELKEKLSVSKKARFAVGWFFLTGLRELKDEIEGLEKLEILVGAKTNRLTVEAMLLEKKYEQAVEDAIEETKYLPPPEINKILDDEFKALVDHISFIKPTEENIEFIKWFFEKLCQKKIEIRIYPKETLHAKLYLLDYKDTRHGPGMAFVGSSNLSVCGFNLNTELNIAVGGDYHEELGEWFKKRWEESERTDFTALAQKALKKSWVMNEEVTPFRLYLRILHEMFSIEESGIPEANYGNVELYDYQKDAVIDAYHRLDEFGGVFLADVPGLGKTYMGAALLAHLQEDGKRAIVVSPPKVVEHWQEVLGEFGVGTAKVVSLGKLDAILRDEKLLSREIVLIDEAHHFRNPGTNHYQDLEMLCEGKKVILVGATPQNLSIWDLYHQIKLFTPSEVDHKFRIDPPSLKEYFKACENKEGSIENLIADIVIRRTRKNILDAYGKERSPKFPERKGPYRVEYSIDKVYSEGIYRKLNNLIDHLTFARYDIGSMANPDAFTDDEKQRLKQAGTNLRKIMRMILFRRLESSIQAFKDSVSIMHQSHLAFLKELSNGRVLAGESAEDVVDQLRSGVDLEDIEYPEETYAADKFRKKELEEGVSNDRRILSEMWDLVRNIQPEGDDKLRTLIELLRGETLLGKKAIIFTSFASTAKYLGVELKKRFANVDYVSQDTGLVLTKAKRFAPKANRYKVDKGEEINILVSTEMLSEGINLQDGQVVINYELHWNPVRIIQRIGRIDRIGSEHDEIYVYNFFPQQEVEREINVEKKVRDRIEEIIKIYGADTQTITQEEEEVTRRLFQVYTEDKRSLEDEEIASKAGYYRQQYSKLSKEYQDEYSKCLNLPAMVNTGIGSKEDGIAVFCRTDDYYRLILAAHTGEITSRNDWEVLGAVACDKDTPNKKLHESHYKVIEKVRESFEEDVNRREQQKVEYLEKITAQLIKKLEWARRGKSEKFKSETNNVIDLLRESKLTLAEKRGLRKIRSKHGLSPQELVDEVRGAVENCGKREPRKVEKKYAQVIISESLS